MTKQELIARKAQIELELSGLVFIPDSTIHEINNEGIYGDNISDEELAIHYKMDELYYELDGIEQALHAVQCSNCGFKYPESEQGLEGCPNCANEPNY